MTRLFDIISVSIQIFDGVTVIDTNFIRTNPHDLAELLV